MDEIHLYAIDFFNALLPSEQLELLDLARKGLRRTKMATFRNDDRKLKAHLFLLERLEKFLEGEDFGGYMCDIHVCDEPAMFYNSNVDAFYCKEHN